VNTLFDNDRVTAGLKLRLKMLAYREQSADERSAYDRVLGDALKGDAAPAPFPAILKEPLTL